MTTTTREELARLIDTAWKYPREHLVDHHMDAAAAILTRFDLVPKGSVVVPAEPTAEMLAAAFEQATRTLLESNSECKTDEERSAKSVRPLYRAMLAARPGASHE